MRNFQVMEFTNGNIKLSDDFYNNIIIINNEEFMLSYLNPNIKSNKGSNSNIFIIRDMDGETEDRVIKICKSPYKKKSKDKRIHRFLREIKAFKLVNRQQTNGVIKYFGDGIVEIDKCEFLYIILEKADNDLANYLETNHFNFTSNQKLSFCVNIINNFKKLHELGIYHRDIKHDNILVLDNELKIGDLGLVEFRDKDFSMDSVNEKIGPIGWLSPEATNKMLTDGKIIGNKYDCIIDEKSDIFQLGKLFWYIFQGNLPTGQILIEDTKFDDKDIYTVIFAMIQYNKDRRPSIDEINNLFKPIKAKLFV